MGFIEPSPPPFDLDEWRSKPYLERLKANAQDWAVNGFGTPDLRLLALRRQADRVRVGAFLLIGATTPGIGGLGDIGDWWTEPIVFQKLAVWLLLWEILGLGSGSMPLAFRFSPPIGGCLYWLRPRTVRLPPWPDKVPLTAGRGARSSTSRSTPASSPRALPAVLGRRGGRRPAAGRLDPVAIAVLLASGPARPAGQGAVPRGATGDLRLPAARLAVPDREHDRRLAARLHLHLVGRRGVEAEPPLPVRDRGDGHEHAVEPRRGR